MQTQQMNDNHWKIAHDLASELHNSGTDVNEFGKVVAFMRRYQKAGDTIEQFILLLQSLANSGDAFSRSNATPQYLKSIKSYCDKHLKDISDVDELMLILGWCRRLMYYYREEPKRAAKAQMPPQQQHRIQTQAPKQPVLAKKEEDKPKIAVHDKVDATIKKKEGINVTIQLDTDHKEILIFERPYYPRQVGDQIKVRVQGVNDKGQVTKVLPTN